MQAPGIKRESVEHMVVQLGIVKENQAFPNQPTTSG
jgi:hypothetical protein